MPNDVDVPSHLNIRIEPKVRYLTELAARARGMSLTAYVESALMASLREVYLDGGHISDSLLTLEDRQERLTPPIDTFAHYADGLWSESPGKRLALRLNFDHLLSEEEKKIWDYIMSHDAYSTGTKSSRKPNHIAISENWLLIKSAALKKE